MLKGTVSRLVIPLAVGCSGLIILAGCENAQRAADASAAAQVEKAEKARQDALNADDLAKAQTIFDSVARDSALSPQQKVLAAGAQAQLHYQILVPQIAQLQSKQFDEIHLIGQIMELSHQIGEAQSQVAALQATDPSVRVAALQTRIADLQGDGGKTEWSMEVQGAKLSGPTLSKLKADIDDLNQKIAANKQETETTQKAKSDANDQAETLTRNAEGETGDPQQQDNAKASDLRKQAAYADSHVNVLTLALGKLQTQLDWNLAQQKFVQANIDSYNKQIQAIQSDWKITQDQIADLQKQQQQLIAGDGTATSAITLSSISGLADKLATSLSDAATLRTSLTNDLGTVITQFGTAETNAQSLRNSLMSNSRGTDPIDLINQATMQTLHPYNYKIQAAVAKQQLADISAGGTEINWLITKVMKGYDASPEEMAELATANEASSNNLPAVPGAGESPLQAVGSFLQSLMGKPSTMPATPTATTQPDNTAATTQPDSTAAATTQPAAAPPAAVVVAGPKVHVEGLATVLSKDRTGIDMPKSLAGLQLMDDPGKPKSDVDGQFDDAVKEYADSKSLPADMGSGPDVTLENMYRSDTSLIGQASTNIEWAEFDRLMGDNDGAMLHHSSAMDAQQQVSAVVRAKEEAAAAASAAAAAAAAPPPAAPSAPSAAAPAAPAASGAPAPAPAAPAPVAPAPGPGPTGPTVPPGMFHPPGAPPGVLVPIPGSDDNNNQ